VKQVVLVVFLLLVANILAAQVIFRNDFVINRKQRKLENKGLTFISINLDNRPNWNQLINGRGGRMMVIDMQALRKPHRTYTYRELAEKVYVPTSSVGPGTVTVPLFLLMVPPVMRKIPVANLRHRNKI
jgi:hypothetical protein